MIDTKENKVTIRLAATEACNNCAGCEIIDDQAILKDIENSLKVKKGDTVLIDNKPKNIIMGAVIVYLLPLIFIVVGYFIGVLIVAGLNIVKDFAILIALIMLVLAFPVVRIIDNRLSRKSTFKPVLAKKL